MLAAGLGERLRPLTNFLPKPLLPIAGRPVCGHTLRALRAAGCEAAALNLHHLGGAIRSALGAEYEGLPLTYADEPALLGTLGPLHALRSFLGAADQVLLVNGDSLCRWPFARLLAAHRRSGAAATLLLAKRASAAEYGGGVAVDRDGRVVSLRGSEPLGEVAARYVFAGAHVLRADLVAAVPAGPGDIMSGLYAPLLAGGARLQTVVTGRHWHDLGTARRYLDAALDWERMWWRGSRHEPGSAIEEGSRLRRSVVSNGARVSAGAVVESSVLLAGAEVAPGCAVSRCVLGPGVHLPSGARIDSRLVTSARPGELPRAPDSMVGGLIYSPLDPRP